YFILTLSPTPPLPSSLPTRRSSDLITGFQRIVLRPSAFVPPPAPSPPYTVFLRLSPPLSVNGRLLTESRETVDLREANVTLISRSEEHTLNSSHEWISYAVFCLNKK